VVGTSTVVTFRLYTKMYFAKIIFSMSNICGGSSVRLFIRTCTNYFKSQWSDSKITSLDSDILTTSKEQHPRVYGIYVCLRIFHNQNCRPNFNTKPVLQVLQIHETRNKLHDANKPFLFEYGPKWLKNNAILISVIMRIEILAPCNNIWVVLRAFFSNWNCR
jgi:hypothetical protein